MSELETKDAELARLYKETGKHSKYQILPRRLREKLEFNAETTLNHYEQERLNYMLQNLDVRDKTLVDVGGNTGFFSLELLEQDVRQVDFYEGKKGHCAFVKIAAEILGYDQRMNVHPQYLEFDQDVETIHTDIMLLLNVLHHIGDDFGDPQLTKEASLQKISQVLQRLSYQAKTLVFQVGFCWHGNRNTVLFDQGTKQQVIDFVREATASYWTIEQIGIAWPTANGIEYQAPNSENLARRDDLREFLNRPLFILKSERYSGN